MLPVIPSGVIQASTQQDVAKPRPDPAPVAPIEPSPRESQVELDRRHPQESEEMLREEQRRRQRKRYTPQELAEGETDAEDQQALSELPRQGVWVDVEV